MNNYLLNTDYTFANEDYEAYVNAAIGAGPYQSIVFEGLFKVEDILQDEHSSIVYSSYEEERSIEDVEGLMKKEVNELTEKEKSFRMAHEYSEVYGAISEVLSYHVYTIGGKKSLQVIETFLIEKDEVFVVFSALTDSNYKAKIITKDIKKLHLAAASVLEDYFIKPLSLIHI